jgi:putative flippase GtrA
MDSFNIETFFKLLRFGIVGVIGMAIDFGHHVAGTRKNKMEPIHC